MISSIIKSAFSCLPCSIMAWKEIASLMVRILKIATKIELSYHVLDSH